MKNLKSFLIIGLISCVAASSTFAQQTPPAQHLSLSQQLSALQKHETIAQSTAPQPKAIDPASQAAVSELYGFFAKDIKINFLDRLATKPKFTSQQMKASPIVKANPGREKDVMAAMQAGSEQFTLSTMGMDKTHIESNIQQTMSIDDVNKLIAIYKSPQIQKIETSSAVDGVCGAHIFSLSCMWSLQPQIQMQIIQTALNDADAAQSFYMQMEAVRPAWQKFDTQQSKTIEAMVRDKTIMGLAKEAAGGSLEPFFKAEFDKRGLVWVPSQR